MAGGLIKAIEAPLPIRKKGDTREYYVARRFYNSLSRWALPSKGNAVYYTEINS